MNQERRGYGAAAEHFGKTTDVLKELCRGTKKKAAEARGPGPEWSSLEAADYWAQTVDENMRLSSEAKGIAASNHMRLAMDARRTLDAIAVPGDRDMDEDEIRLQLEADMLLWSDQFLELALRVYGERHHGRILLVTETHRAELRDGEWSTETK
jgi:hypothetical protein